MSATPTMLRAGSVLGLFAVVAAGVLAGTHALTKDRIAAAERQRLLTQLEAVLPVGAYDNDVAHDIAEFSAPELGGPQPVAVYRARRAGAPVAAVLSVTAPNGYSGPVALLVGVRVDGTLSGVRVVAHKETPGLGDKIDLSRSDWILDFNDRALGNPDDGGWRVRKDGGVFDQFAGATITPRAVVKAVHDALRWFESHRDALFATLPAAQEEAS